MKLFIIASVIMIFASAVPGSARADDTSEAQEQKILELQKRLAELEGLLRQNPPSAEIENCAWTNLRKVAVGFKCTTSKGSTVERVAHAGFGEAWKNHDGLIWSDTVGGGNNADARYHCRTLGARLPSEPEVFKGRAHGLFEVLPSQDKPYWTSTATYNPLFYYYGDKYGSIGDKMKSYSLFIRCVTKQK